MFRGIILSITTSLLYTTSPGLRAQERYFDSRGVKIHYTTQGRGEPVVFIHGFSVNYPFQFVYPGISAAVAKQYQVIGMDCRGHGRSGKPRDAKLYGQEMVEDVVRLLDHLKIQKAHIVGYSMGGFIALRMAATHPDRILSLTTGGAGATQKIDENFLGELADSLEAGKGIGPLIRRLTPAGYHQPTDQELRLPTFALKVFNDSKALAAVIRSLKELAISEETLKKNIVPTLALIGELDPLKEGVDGMEDCMPNLEIVVIKGANHMNAFFRPEFKSNLLRFLGEHPQKVAAKDAQIGKEAVTATIGK